MGRCEQKENVLEKVRRQEGERNRVGGNRRGGGGKGRRGGGERAKRMRRESKEEALTSGEKGEEKDKKGAAQRSNVRYSVGWGWARRWRGSR